MHAKVFTQIYDGTLCTKGPWEALVTFQQLLVLADQDGVVDMTAQAIARRTTIPLDIIERGIAALLLPDPESRTPTEQGRRIVPLSEGRAWGWLVVNYQHYRQLKREDDRRAYHREYWHKRKLKESTATQHTQPNQPIAYAEAEAEANAKAVKTVGGAKRRTQLPDDFFPNESGVKVAETKGCSVAVELQKFTDYHRGKGSVMADWQAAWRTWIGNARTTTTSARAVEPAWRAEERERIRKAVPGIAERTASTDFFDVETRNVTPPALG